MYNVFVFCGGKCGSTTLHETFKKNKYNSVHIHSNVDYQLHINNNSSVFNEIDLSCKKYKKIYIIDSYRTPIERKISSFFQNIDKHLPNYNELSIEEMVNFFNNNLLYKLEEYHSINEVLKHYNIPLINKFNFDKKYIIVRQKNKIFIKLLFKNINEWDKILSEILKKEIVLHNNNLTENKKIYNLYNIFKENYKVPKKYITDILVNDTEFKIYNNVNDQEKYIESWLKKSY
jgi:hypothetical protein